jgi:hypothetical protein
VGGTVTGLKEGTMGRLDLTLEKGLVFVADGARHEIPYALITSHRYREELARRAGVVATIVVVLVKHRRRRHFIEVNYRSDDGTPQVAIFEVSKESVQTVTAVLNARATKPRSASMDCARYPLARPCQPEQAAPPH